MRSGLSRRTFLCLGGALVGGSLGGCMESDTDDQTVTGSSSESPTSRQSTTPAGSIRAIRYQNPPKNAEVVSRTHPAIRNVTPIQTAIDTAVESGRTSAPVTGETFDAVQQSLRELPAYSGDNDPDTKAAWGHYIRADSTVVRVFLAVKV